MDIKKYIAHHSDIVYKIEGNNVLEINETFFDKTENKDDRKLLDFKFSFDENNFENQEQILTKLNKLVEDFKNIKADSSFEMKLEKSIPIDNKDKIKEFENKDDIKILNKEFITKIWNRKERNLVKFTYKKTMKELEL